MEFFTPISHDVSSSLGMALVFSSATPLLLLDANLVIRAASGSFCSAFDLDPDKVVGAELPSLGLGEWALPQLRSLLCATVAGDAAIKAYELDLVRLGQPTRMLVVNAHRLDYLGSEDIRIALAVSDVTDARLTEKLKDDVVREKQVLLQELQHRVANSLQIIASVLMQSARKVQSDEARNHLQDAHHRVMSIATLQRQLAASKAGEVVLRTYFTDLCDSIGASMIYDHQLLKLSAIVDESVTSSEVSVSLGLIVTELVINSLKHAFPERTEPGEITVEYWSQPTGWRLSVEDNGVGMPGDHATRKPGLGTGIVDALAKQLDAAVTVTDTSPGTRVAIVHYEVPAAL
ncbi:sensor histidine kinase [Sphingomonas sp. LB-2]|uniref:sensor histidine kinase n=1 Tax=Sphingomonas caeni TaxID=2984949 RepID=UPI00222F3860|nr:PAS domain-containing sensor histidine kinase [Sphingomonas caeni]MCW3849145.1 sensor histidine kinase [Sphingomonas caeni]